MLNGFSALKDMPNFGLNIKTKNMNNLIRTLIAGWGAKKIGGGCFGTIVAFFIIYYLLGYCHR